MIRRFFLLIIMALFITLPLYKKYLYSFIQKNFYPQCSLIDLNCIRDITRLDICNNDDLKELIKIISSFNQKIALIDTLNEEEKLKICKQVIENYIIDPYLVEKYLEDNNLLINADFIKEQKIFMNIMQNIFYINYFKRHIGKNISISDEFAKSYYENNRFKEFNKKPFVKKSASIDARIIEIKKDDQNYTQYETLLLSDDTSIRMAEFNPYIDNSIIGETLKKMNSKSYDIVTIEGTQYMLYKIDETEGLWEDYSKVKDSIKQYIYNKTINKQIENIITKTKNTCQIKVCESTLKKYIRETISFLKNS